MSNTIRLATVVEGKGGGGGLGGLLSRAAAWGCQLEAEGEEEREDIGWQVRRFWRGFRLPGETTDVLAGPWENVKPPLSGVPVCNGDSDGDREGHSEGNVNAIAWLNGRAHTLRIIQNRKPVRESDIRRQLDYITSLPASPPKDGEASIALLSWRSDRTSWSQLHSQLLSHSPNLPAFKKLYNSAISIALDPALVAPSSPGEDEDGLARLLDETRHGKYSPNRHADVTFGIVSFGYGEQGNGKIGLTFDHTPADCGAAMELSKILASPIAQKGEIVGEECNFIPETLEFTFPPGTNLNIPNSVQEKIPRGVRTLTLNTTARSYVSGGLVDICLNLSLQATMSSSSSTNGHHQTTWPVIYQPVSQPNCYKGRCGPGCCTTTESITFLSSLFPSSPSPSSSSGEEEEEEEETLIPTFEKYLSRRRDVISAARTGTI